MSQTSYTVANQTFPDTRANLNAVFDAIKTLNAGTGQPPDMAPGMPWLDTSGGGAIIRLRNAANDGWISFMNLQTGTVFGGVIHLTNVSGVNTITATAPSSVTSYVDGQTFSFVAAGANTTVATLNINGVGQVAVQKHGNTAPASLSASDIRAGSVYFVTYKSAGPIFFLTSPSEFLTFSIETLYGSWTAGNYLKATGARTMQQLTPAAVRSDIGAVSSADVAAAVPKIFTSGGITWTNGGSATVSHGLGAAPHGARVKLTCVNAEGGYAPGQVLFIADSVDNGAVILPGTFIMSSTSVAMRFGTPSAPSNAIAIVANGSTGARAILTAPNWTMQFMAWRFL